MIELCCHELLVIAFSLIEETAIPTSFPNTYLDLCFIVLLLYVTHRCPSPCPACRLGVRSR